MEEIATRQVMRETGNSMEGLRSVFEPGEREGDHFISLLFRASEQGLISGVSFIPRNCPCPEEAIWDGVKLTDAGKNAICNF